MEMPTDWQKTFDERAARARNALTPEMDSVFHDLYTFERIPGAPTVGLVVEPYSDFHVSELAYVGRMLVAAAGRTLYTNGLNIHPIFVSEIEKSGLPSPEELPALVLFPGKYRVSDTFTNALKTYRAAGGRFLWVAGTDPAGLTGEIAANLRPRTNDELPTSTLWSIQNEEIYGQMRVAFSSELQSVMGDTPFSFRTNPNFDGFAKPQCQFSIEPSPAVEPLAFLNNGQETFCVAADTTTGWRAMTLDTFGTPLVLWSVRRLLSCPAE